VWFARDFAEGEVSDDMLAIRFANSENALKFKEEYEKHQKANATIISGGKVEAAAPAAAASAEGKELPKWASDAAAKSGAPAAAAPKAD